MTVSRVAGTVDPAALAYNGDGLLPVIVQDVASGAVLMLAWADRDAVERTLATGEAHFWSRSRRRPWRKGETSGNVLAVVEARTDCDGDALLLRADPHGPTCHRGVRSCFDPAAEAAPAEPPPHLELGWLWGVIRERAAEGSSASQPSSSAAGFGSKQERAPVWQVGPAGRARTRSASRSQSARTSTTSSTLPEVSPLRQSSCRERLQK